MTKKLFLFLLAIFSVPSISFAQSAAWSPVGPAYFPTNVSGQIHGISRISQLKFHPTDSNKLYAVSARGGLFISNNGGNSWSIAPGCDILPGMRLASICVDHSNDQILYLGTGDHNYYYNGSGVYKSTNGGATFSATTLTSKLVVDMVMDPSNNQVIVAATNAGIYKTSNGGTSWSLKTASRAFDDLKEKRPGSRVLYAATTDSAFFKSTDYGDTWIQITNGIVLPAGVTNGNGCRIAVTPADTNVVYLGMVTNGGIVYKSSDGGDSFTAVKTTPPPYLTYYTNAAGDVGQGDYNFSIGVDRTDPNIIYLVAHAVWKSTDGGVTWSQLTNWWAKVHTDMHQIITSPYNNNKLWNMNDGGVWLSTDGGNNWSPKSDGIYGYEIYHGATSPTRKDMISIGTQDNGELYYQNTGTGWFCNRGGDWSATCSFDFFPNSQRVYYYSSAKRRNVTGGESSFGLPLTGFKDIAFYRSQPNIAFVGDSNVYRTSNLSATTPAWTLISSFTKRIAALHVSQADSNRVYAITTDQNIFVSTNAMSASPTFTQYALPYACNNAAGIVSVKNNPNVLYAILNTRVYKSTDNGATWVNVTYNLPSVNYRDIITDDFYPGTELMIVAGGNNSVYFKLGSQTTWTLFNQQLPSRTTINDVSLFDDGTNNSVLRVTTYGRGVWETPISSLRAVNASFISSTNTPCTSDSVQFNDLSTGSPTSWSWSFPGGSPATSNLQNPKVQYASAGVFSVSLSVSGPGGNNSITKNNYISTLGQAIPVVEDLENAVFPPSEWSNIDVAADGKTWTRAQVSAFGNGSGAMLFDNYTLDSYGTRDEVRTKKFDLSGFASYQLKFDVAHQLYSTSPGYLDSLSVLISDNCSSTYTGIYVKPGTTLATVPGTGGYFTPTASQWRTDSVDISAYGGKSIQLSFVNHGHYGNNIYVDNIQVNGINPVVTLNLKMYFEGFYNPLLNQMQAVSNPLLKPTVTDTVMVHLTSATAPYTTIYSDQDVILINGTGSMHFPIAALNNSFYVVVKHRNSLETWSKTPVLFNSSVKSLDFTSP